MTELLIFATRANVGGRGNCNIAQSQTCEAADMTDGRSNSTPQLRNMLPENDQSLHI